jgi:hypothetical protein
MNLFNNLQDKGGLVKKNLIIFYHFVGLDKSGRKPI